jgi:hypothetical protein
MAFWSISYVSGLQIWARGTFQFTKAHLRGLILACYGWYYLLQPPSRTGHLTPRPTPWTLCLCHIHFHNNIMLGRRGEPLFGRLRAQTTSTKTPVVASPTQADMASGVCPTNLRISAGASRMKLTKWPYFNVKFIEFSFLFSKICFMPVFNFSCILELQDGDTFKIQVGVEDQLVKNFWDFKIEFKEAEHDKSLFMLI